MTTTTKEALEPCPISAVDAMWEALKAACCKNPAEAKLAVFVSEKKFKEALAPFAAPIAPVVDDTLCLLCGHKGVAPDGTCMVPVPICSDDYHGTRRCGCRCNFKDAPAATVAPQQSEEAGLRDDGFIEHDLGDKVIVTRAPASPAAPSRSVQHLVNQWQAAWLSTQDISRDSEADLVRRIEALIFPVAPILHCSCGAACTPDEYAAHRAMGHDAPAALRDEAERPRGIFDAGFAATTPPSTLARKAAEIETHLGTLPFSLIDEIHERRQTIYRGLDYRLSPDVAAKLKTDLDYLMAFAVALRPASSSAVLPQRVGRENKCPI